MRPPGGTGPRRPPDAPGAAARRRGQLLGFGAAGVFWEVVGAFMGGSRGGQFATAGLWLTLASALVFAGDLAFAVVRGLWRGRRR